LPATLPLLFILFLVIYLNAFPSSHLWKLSQQMILFAEP